MLTPKAAFDDFGHHIAAFTVGSDADIEGQFFERKQAGACDPAGNVSRSQVDGLREQIIECISAFANSNKEGGLIAIGISKTGAITGINRLTDVQRNSITNFTSLLRNHAAQARFFDCTDVDGKLNKIALIYSAYVPFAICETADHHPKAWTRNGAQNVLLDDVLREQLRRDKGIFDDEAALVCPYHPEDIDPGVLNELRRSILPVVPASLSNEEFLHQVGAIERAANGGWEFTRAGMLFFAANPQRKLSASHIRLLRFDCTLADGNRSSVVSEKQFGGPITKQIRDFRTFVAESAFFKVFQFRKPTGGFHEEPEYPAIAVDEAIVNAVAHRDYCCTWPVECEAYHDAFVVKNAGRIIQRAATMPQRFSLDECRLVHMPRNPKLFEWLKAIRDSEGTPFVRALSEGTRRMNEEMTKLGLPAPAYEVSERETRVTLYGDQARRSAAAKQHDVVASTEHTNLFPIELRRAGGVIAHCVGRDDRHTFLLSLRDALAAKEWFIDSIRQGFLTAHVRGGAIPVPEQVRGIVRLYPAYVFAVREYGERSYLLIDFSLEVKSVLTFADAISIVPLDKLLGRTCTADVQDWQRGRIVAVDDERVTVRLFDYETEHTIRLDRVYPDLPVSQIRQILATRGIGWDMDAAIKKHSLAAVTGAARLRDDRIRQTATDLVREVFPFKLGTTDIHLLAEPLPLSRDAQHAAGLLARSVGEPAVEFAHDRATANIREGITEFGAYDGDQHEIELVPVVDYTLREQMAALIERLKGGKYKYRGSERTFRTRFTYGSIITVSPPSSVVEECKRLLSEHPDWRGNIKLDRIFLVHAPELGFAADDQLSPYYVAKRLLLEAGIPCQMVDTPTLRNADWKDLNLALNLVAKCGVTPWVLPEGIPDADFFIGLSYTQSRQAGVERLMGYTNVFNEFGRWLFYSGNTQVFGYEERQAHLGPLVRDTMMKLPLADAPNLYLHYSARFSFADREAIVRAAREVRPKGTYSFVWLNSHHRVRLFDTSAETDGSVRRGSFVVTAPNQVLVSTTGYNPFRKAMGTPQMLEVNVWRYCPPTVTPSEMDLRAVAVQVIALTKLNWSSTDSLCGEPITTKYAGDIAYLTSAFLRQGTAFQLHQVLEATPWFI